MVLPIRSARETSSMTAQQPAVTSSFMKSGISGKVLMLERWAAGKDYSAAPVEDDGCCFFTVPHPFRVLLIWEKQKPITSHH